MRSAKLFGTIRPPKIDPARLEEILAGSQGFRGYASPWGIDPETRRPLDALWPKAMGHGLWSSLWLDPHTDDVLGDITLGIIIKGDHYLYTGNGRRVGDLVPGTVFALCNKKKHGAYPRDSKNPSPLVFITCEPSDVEEEDWPQFCRAIAKKMP